MNTYFFSELTNNQILPFDPEMDQLVFDVAGISAATGTFSITGPDLYLSYQNKTIRLAGSTLAQLSSSHFTFTNGGKLLVGDDSPATLEDDLANTLNGTAWGDYLDGLGGADRLYGRKHCH